MQHPIIGILGAVDNDIITRLQNTYTRAIEFSGGAPILLPYVKNDKSIDTFVNICDGFLFTGGVDINPLRYKEKIKSTCGDIQNYRDELEFKAFEKIYPTGKPIMAICRGAQLVNVALGGTLYQDISTEIHTSVYHIQSEPKSSPSHKVKILTDTPLKNLLSDGQISVNSFHHQAIKELGDGLRVMALADDGIIEAVYSTEKRYIRAYQWHPECLFEIDKSNCALFEDFTAACKTRK